MKPPFSLVSVIPVIWDILSNQEKSSILLVKWFCLITMIYATLGLLQGLGPVSLIFYQYSWIKITDLYWLIKNLYHSMLLHSKISLENYEKIVPFGKDEGLGRSYMAPGFIYSLKYYLINQMLLIKLLSSVKGSSV